MCKQDKKVQKVRKIEKGKMNQETTNPGNLIKNGNRQMPLAAAPDNQKIIKNQIIKAREEAARIVHEAEAFARETHEIAIDEAEEIRERAFREGMETALAEFEENLFAVREVRARVWRETEQDLLRLAVRLAEKIVGQEIQKDNRTVVNIIATALQNARQQEKLTVRVNPTNLALVEKEIENFASGGRTRFLDFVADPRVSFGGCLIESEVGTIDAQLETQFRILERVLLVQSEGETMPA